MSAGYLRYPHIHGDSLVFVADNDLWLGNLAGGRAHRLTTAHAPVRTPRFSPDGTRIAYARETDGGLDVHVLSLDGESRRLTWLADPLLDVSDWLDDTHILISSGHASPLRSQLGSYSLSLDGDLARLPWGQVRAAHQNADGRVVVASSNRRGPEQWKRYRGGRAIRLWVSDAEQQTWSRLLPDETASIAGPMWLNDRIWFASDRGASLPGNAGEQAQLWSVNPDGSDLQQHTHHTSAEGYVRDATTDGVTVVYHARGTLYSLRPGQQAAVIDIETGLGAPAPKRLEPTDQLLSIQPDHGGDGSVLEWRGAAWYVTHRDGPARALSDLPGVRIREPRLLGNTGKAVWASDADGEDCLEIMGLDGDGDPRRIARGKVGRILELEANAEGTKVAVASHDGNVYVVDVARASVKRLGRSTQGEASGLAFSPDGRYLVWREALVGEGYIGRLVGYDLVGGRAFQLTRGQFDDFSPCFSLDGRCLYFLSSRTIDPSYDALGFDLSFTNAIRPWVIMLRAEDSLPFGPLADGWAISEDDMHAALDSEKHDTPSIEMDDTGNIEMIVFDVAGAEERMAPLPVPGGRYHNLQPIKTGVAWQRKHPYTGELGTGRLPGDPVTESAECYDMTKRKLVVLVDACDSATVSGDGKQLVVRSDDQVWVQSTAAKPSSDDDKIMVDLSRLNRTILPRNEWLQMFDENTRIMRDHFWREDMDGVDWAEVVSWYRPLVERMACYDDLADVLWEVGAELNTSHSYVIPPKADGPRLGWLGAEFSRTSKNELKIERVLPGESSDPSARSPLLAAGVGARPGDVIAAINGCSTAEVPDVGALLENTAGKVVELTLVRRRMKRRVAVVPIASEASLRYHEWVAGRVAYTAEHSDGRVGYLHVPDMAVTGWAQFQRLIEQASACEAVIVDVRDNGGGHTSELLLERLSRTVTGWSRARHFDAPITYPTQAMRGPVIFVTDPNAGSDGDIVTAAAQQLGLGPVVGERSWGGVVGIDGRFKLVDGTIVTQPRYSFWFPQLGWGLENWGTEPDIEVPMGPAEWEASNDLQLDVAIAEALRQLDQTPAATPPDLEAPRAGS